MFVGLVALVIVLASDVSALNDFRVSPTHLNLNVGGNNTLEILTLLPAKYNTKIVFSYQVGSKKAGRDRIPIYPLSDFDIPANSSQSFKVSVLAKSYGQVVILVNKTHSTSANPSTFIGSCDVAIARYAWIFHLQTVIGWMYFVFWTVSFYPQCYLNFKRKSVVGLNFDFLLLNTFGFFAYSCYNSSLFFSPFIQQIYRETHLSSLIPVELNDVVFSVHAFIICALTGLQCLLYDRGQQKISRFALAVVALFTVIIFVIVILAASAVLSWLFCLNAISITKILISVIKYIPQVIMNYRRKSTVGWSIVNVMLDFSGGALSFLQMAIIAYNYDDWQSLAGNITKLGLGVISILFDCVFICQHYFLYRNANVITEHEVLLPDSNTDDSLEQS